MRTNKIIPFRSFLFPLLWEIRAIPAAVYQIGAAVAANSGPRVVGTAFTRKKEENGKD